MTISLKANSDGTSGAIQVNGTDVITIDSGGRLYAVGTIEALTPDSGTTGGVRIRGNATSGNAYFQITNSDASAQWAYGVITSGGAFTWSGNITGYSDRKLKKDIVTIDNALAKVCAMRGVYYTRIDTDARNIGVIAQEVQEIFPEAVLSNSSEDGDITLSVAYGNLIGALIEAVKELKAEINELKK